jgi:hypothetical protein
VYVDKDGQVRYARAYALKLMGCPAQVLPDEVAEINQGDLFVAFADSGNRKRAELLKDLERRGVQVMSSTLEPDIGI